MEIVRPTAKYVVRGKVVPAQSIAPLGSGKRKEPFPGHPLSVRTNDLGIEVLWCDVCGCPVSQTTKSTVQGHLDCKKHQAAVETMKKREKALVERRLEAEAEALPRKAAMRQPSLQSVVASCNKSSVVSRSAVFLRTAPWCPSSTRWPRIFGNATHFKLPTKIPENFFLTKHLQLSMVAQCPLVDLKIGCWCIPKYQHFLV